MERMKKFIVSLLLGFVGMLISHGQVLVVQGNATDAQTNQVIEGAMIVLQGSSWNTRTDANGFFKMADVSLPKGEQVLLIEKEGYVSQRIAIVISTLNSENIIPIRMQLDLSFIDRQVGIIQLGEVELSDENGFAESTPGLLEASNDVFLTAAAYNFSNAFFRPRGLGSEYSQVLINGVEMNQIQTGRPLWRMWGGLNDVQRNRTIHRGLEANETSFGNLGGSTNFVMKAAEFRKGGQVSIASSNRSYTARLMASFHSGRTLKGWAYSFLLSHRFGASGYVEGTSYEAPSFFASVEKVLNVKQRLNLSAFYTPNQRGKSTALTQEVQEIKGTRYNPFWGIQNGKLRNSRANTVSIPVIMLNHDWEISENIELHSSLTYQKGAQNETRLDNGGLRNPYANYYQRLPSYFLRNATPLAYDYQLAYLAEAELKAKGQLDWNALYDTNRYKSSEKPGYHLFDDVTAIQQFEINALLEIDLNGMLTLIAGGYFKNFRSENYALAKDLLGGNAFHDIDSYYQGNELNFELNDVRFPNRMVEEGDRFKYSYDVKAIHSSVFGQLQYKHTSWNAFIAAQASVAQYQRIGNYKNGYFQEDGRSLGASDPVNFAAFGIKGGMNYSITGRHYLAMNSAYLTKPPVFKNIFPNIRQNNDVVADVNLERIKALDLSYAYRTSRIKSKLTGYYLQFQDQTDVGYFFTQNAIGAEDNTAFVQEILQGVDKTHLGIEFGFEIQILPSLSINSAVAWGQFYYANNPTIYLSGDDFDAYLNDSFVEGNDLSSRGKRSVYLKNYHIAAGPEQAYQLGFNYRDPNYWWVGVAANYFSNAYIDISALRRSEDFALAEDEVSFANYDPMIARDLLKQEQLKSYFLLNLVGGKSFRLDQHYLGFFLSVNNVLNQKYKTGGFEDSRRANYLQQKEEQNRPGGPLFGTRYYAGNGTTYYLNFYIRF